MFEITKSFRFDAGHVLTRHNGKCCRPHGHTYSLDITVRTKELQSTGSTTNMVVDFNDISNLVKPMIEAYFDHHWINDTLETDSPTVEFMAKWIYRHLKPQMPILHAVSLYETPTSKARYWEES